MPDPTLLDAASPDSDFDAAAVVAVAAKRRVKVRVLAQLYQYGTGQRYKHWNGVVWRLEVDPDPAAGQTFREALQAFFRALTTVGAEQLIHLLNTAVKDALPMSRVEEQP